jgi:ferredoxin
VDRVACTGHGVCASLLRQVELDEWGYPVVLDAAVPAQEATTAIRLCPARALYLR